MAACSFCENSIQKGTGKIYVKKDGKIFNFCSRKCEKNMITLKRKPRQTKWSEAAHKIKKSEKKATEKATTQKKK